MRDTKKLTGQALSSISAIAGVIAAITATTLSLPEIASREIASLSETRPYTTQELLALPKGHLLNFDEVAAYVHESTRGIVKTSELGKTKGKSFQFLVDTKRQVIANSRPEVPDTIQDLFDFDLDRFISDSGLPDFASAKRAYYDETPFNQKTQLYVHRFLYPEDWKSLFHPPVKKLTLDPLRYDAKFIPREKLPQESPYYTAEFHRATDAATGTHVTFGNQLELLTNRAAFDKKLELSRKAKRSILVGVMTYMCDKSGRELLAVLGERAKAGVDVRIMMEGLWTSIAFRGCMKKMKDAGIDVVLANDMLKRGKNQGLYHNKFWIFDYEESIIGGHNILNSDNLSTGFNHKNRDTDIWVKGPAVTDMLTAYADLYDRYVNNKRKRKRHRPVTEMRAEIARRLDAETRAQVRGPENYDKYLITQNDTPEQKAAKAVSKNHGVCRYVIQGPQGDRHRITKAYLEYIRAAQYHIALASQKIRYQNERQIQKKGKSKNTDLWQLVKKRAEEGVNIDVISNGIDGANGELSSKLHELADIWWEKGHPKRSAWLRRWIYSNGHQLAAQNREYLNTLAALPNTRTWTFFQFMHNKTVDFDRIALSVGSYNLEDYSAEKSHESTIICQDASLQLERDRQLLRDLMNSTPVVIKPDSKFASMAGYNLAERLRKFFHLGDGKTLKLDASIDVMKMDESDSLAPAEGLAAEFGDPSLPEPEQDWESFLEKDTGGAERDLIETT